MFIVRDWENDDEEADFPQVFEGGKKYFEATTKPSRKRAQEHNIMKSFFSKTFGEISCFLLPEPGKAVRKKAITLGGISIYLFLTKISLFLHYFVISLP